MKWIRCLLKSGQVQAIKYNIIVSVFFGVSAYIISFLFGSTITPIESGITISAVMMVPTIFILPLLICRIYVELKYRNTNVDASETKEFDIMKIVNVVLVALMILIGSFVFDRNRHPNESDKDDMYLIY